MTLKGAILTLFAFVVGSLLLFAGTGPGMLLGGSLIAIAAAAIITALGRRDPDRSSRRLGG